MIFDKGLHYLRVIGNQSVQDKFLWKRKAAALQLNLIFKGKTALGQSTPSLSNTFPFQEVTYIFNFLKQFLGGGFGN